MNNDNNTTLTGDDKLKYVAEVLSNASIEDLVKIWIYSQNGTYDKYSNRDCCEKICDTTWRFVPGKGYEFHTEHGRFLMRDHPKESLILSDLQKMHKLFENHDIDKRYLYAIKHRDLYDINQIRLDGTFIL